MAFLLRQNLIGLWIAFGIVYFIRTAMDQQWKSWFVSIGMMAAGFFGVLSLFLGYFLYQGALGAFWDAAFRYNTAYAGGAWLEHLRGSLYGLRVFAPSGMHVLLMAGWLCGVVQWIGMFRRSDRPRALFMLMGTVVVGLPLEMLLAGLSARGLVHYYIAWLPTAAVLVACVLHRMVQSLPGGSGQRSATNGWAQPVWAWGLMVAMVAATASVTIPNTLQAAKQSRALALVAADIRQATGEEDRVLVWGGEVPINVAAGRKSPSKFCYQYPLFTKGYSSPELTQQFLAELSKNPPLFIIDTSPTSPDVPPLETRDRQQSYRPGDRFAAGAELEPVFHAVARNYSWAGTVPSSQWRVYRRHW